MNQMGFSEMEFAAKKKRTRRERFLDQIEVATPWALLVQQIEPLFPSRCGVGTGAYGGRNLCERQRHFTDREPSAWRGGGTNGNGGYISREKGEEFPDRKNLPLTIAKKPSALRQLPEGAKPVSKRVSGSEVGFSTSLT